jgi:hypothetical protein
MILKIKLSFLDKIAPLSYSNPVFILLDNHPDRVVGTCEIVNDELMNHFANFELYEEISNDLFVYYISKNTNDGIFHLSHLSLHSEPGKDLFTKKIKEMIV